MHSLSAIPEKYSELGIDEKYRNETVRLQGDQNSCTKISALLVRCFQVQFKMLNFTALNDSSPIEYRGNGHEGQKEEPLPRPYGQIKAA